MISLQLKVDKNKGQIYMHVQKVVLLFSHLIQQQLCMSVSLTHFTNLTKFNWHHTLSNINISSKENYSKHYEGLLLIIPLFLCQVKMKYPHQDSFLVFSSWQEILSQYRYSNKVHQLSNNAGQTITTFVAPALLPLS